MKSVKYGICVDHLGRDKGGDKRVQYVLGQNLCHSSHSQYYTLSKDSKLRNEYMCAKVEHSEISMIGCHDQDIQRQDLQWNWIPKGDRQGLLKHTASGKCLKPDEGHNEVNLLVDDCDDTNENLVWQFDYSLEHPG